MTQLSSEVKLEALARRFDTAERRVRALLAQAPDGDRADLLRQALDVLLGLQQRIRDDAIRGAEVAYALAHAATQQLLGREVVIPDPGPATPSGRRLAKRLSDALQTAQDGSRGAFATATRENAQDAAHKAVTALVARGGARLTLGGYTEGAISATARSASSLGIVHAAQLGGGHVRYSIHGSTHPTCAQLEGKVFPAASAPQPPTHPGCGHSLEPVGGGDVNGAIEHVGDGELWRRWYAQRYEAGWRRAR